MMQAGRKLLKIPFRGGMLKLMTDELILSEGVFGTGSVRRFSLAQLVALETASSAAGIGWGLRVRFVWADGRHTDVENVGPRAAERLSLALRALGMPGTSGRLLRPELECSDRKNTGEHSNPPSPR